MRETRSISVEELKAKTPVRRSPRFHHADVAFQENPRTPAPVTKRSRVDDSLPITKKHSDGDGVSPNLGKESCKLRKVTRSGKEYGSSDRSDRGADVNLSDSQKKKKRVTTNSVCRSQSLDIISRDNECGRMYGKKERTATKSKSFEKFGKGVRRSARLARAVDQCENGDAHDLDKQKLMGEIVTRSMVHDFASKHGKVGGFTLKGVSCRRARVLSNERRANAGIDSCKITIDNDKRRTPLSLGPAKVVRSSNGRGKMVSGDDAKPGFDVNYFKPCRSRQDTECSIVTEMGTKNSRQVFFGEGMKRDQVEKESEVVEGWTKEQDSALRKAYFTVKPTPQFWKNVAKMVPRKSAQECFDRIHSDYPTPSEPRARSRVTTKKPASPISFSASKLLKKTVNVRPRRRNTFLAQKTVRKLLEKQQNEDQDYQADFFSVFEPTMDTISFNFEEDAAFDSPAANQKSSILTRFGEEASPSVHSIHRSRLVNSKKAALVSPPVLKQIKNKALHERYIDQLHRRDAKRKAESLRMQRIEKQTSKKTNDLIANSVQVARDVLVNNAYDAISRIRSLQSNADDNAIDGDDTSCSIEDEDEDEDGLC